MPPRGWRLPVDEAKRRFWLRARRTETCWLWTGSGGGPRCPYGLAWFHKRYWLAHRLAWIFSYGPIPEGRLVLHRCDVPRCVRPDHLFLGTYLDNKHDSMAKGRHAHGDNTGPRLYPEKYRGENHWTRRGIPNGHIGMKYKRRR